MHPSTWIVVADSARVHIFTLSGNPKRLEPFREMTHPESRLPNRELRSDKPGRSFESMGQMRHAVTQAVTPKDVEKKKFSLELANRIEHARKEGFVDRLVIVAAPAFLGDLRLNLTPQSARMVWREIPKDLTRLSIHELRPHLPDSLFE